jgi:hypothetical protein
VKTAGADEHSVTRGTTDFVGQAFQLACPEVSMTAGWKACLRILYKSARVSPPHPKLKGCASRGANVGTRAVVRWPLPGTSTAKLSPQARLTPTGYLCPGFFYGIFGVNLEWRHSRLLSS